MRAMTVLISRWGSAVFMGEMRVGAGVAAGIEMPRVAPSPPGSVSTLPPMPKRLNADDREMLADLKTLLLASAQNAQAAATGEDVADALLNLSAQLAQAQAAVARLRERHDAAN